MSLCIHEPSSLTERAAAALTRIHADIARVSKHLHVIHARRLHCEKGCHACCVDDLTVFSIEADLIVAQHAALLQTGVPHAPGHCAFLDEAGACRVYEERPYVCRTQGLPLRWVEDDVEYRDICPLNDVDPMEESIELIPSAACFALGPTEERLARLELESSEPRARMHLRDLFRRKPV